MSIHHYPSMASVFRGVYVFVNFVIESTSRPLWSLWFCSQATCPRYAWAPKRKPTGTAYRRIMEERPPCLDRYGDPFGKKWSPWFALKKGVERYFWMSLIWFFSESLYNSNLGRLYHYHTILSLSNTSLLRAPGHVANKKTSNISSTAPISTCFPSCWFQPIYISQIGWFSQVGISNKRYINIKKCLKPPPSSCLRTSIFSIHFGGHSGHLEGTPPHHVSTTPRELQVLDRCTNNLHPQWSNAQPFCRCSPACNGLIPIGSMRLVYLPRYVYHKKST